MFRNILAVIAGYIVMFVMTALLFTGLYFALGADGAFKPKVFEPSMLWTVMAFVLGTIAAIAGGAVCGLISKKRGAVIALAVIVVVLGMLMVVAQVAAGAKPTEERTGAVSSLDAAMKTVQPLWVTVANPILGAIAVMIGGGLGLPRGRKA